MRDIDSWSVKQKKKWLKKHFLYEIMMFQVSIERVVEYDCQGKSITETVEEECNMAVENCILHARNLTEFLHKEKDTHSDCVRASDFACVHSWQQLPKKQYPDWVEEILKEGSQHIAHLTSTRAKAPYEKRWKCQEIHRNLATAINKFLNVVSPKYSDVRFNNVKDWCEKTMKSAQDSGSVKTTVNQTFFHRWSS